MTYPTEDRVDHPEIQAPPTERLVPETQRTLPTSKNTVLVLSFVSAGLSIPGAVVGLPMSNEPVGLVLVALGLIVGVIAWVMAAGDARSGAITPAVATLTAALFCVILAIDLADPEPPAPAVTPAGVAIPQDPAAIIDPDREKPATQP